jgi:hypothetical protein
VAQCRGTTKKGERCKRDARDGSEFCAIHQDQEIRPRAARSQHTEEWDRDAMMKAAIGLGLVAAIFLFKFKR